MKYIEFNLIGKKKKTCVYAVRNIKSQEIIGYIEWKQWRQYCFYPEPNTVYSAGCLKDIEDFIIGVNYGQRKS